MRIRAGYEIHTLEDPPPAIATQLECRLPALMEFQGEWSVPDAVPSLRPDGHGSYQGDVRFRRGVRVAEGAAGEHRLECTASFQACNDKVCLRPAKVQLAIQVAVVESMASGAGEGANRAEAEELVKKLLDRYRELESYQDTGMAKTVFWKNEQVDRTVERPFKTAWVRPDRFRFEYSEKLLMRRVDHRYIVWMHGDDVQSEWTLKGGKRREQGLLRAIAGVTGVSGGSAYLVSSLLLPDRLGMGVIAQLESLKRIEDGELGEHGCYRITGELEQSTYTVWIDREEPILRRVDIAMSFDGFRTETQIVLEPQLNAPVADEDLAF
jgi:outer membrane lipoprotein-sorting protein